jgi:hypothetical protein
MRQINLRLDEGLLARIDVERGDVPRSVWIRRRLEPLTGERLRESISEHLEETGWKDPSPESRSPELGIETVVSRSPGPEFRCRVAKPVQPRPIVQKRGKP